MSILTLRGIPPNIEIHQQQKENKMSNLEQIVEIFEEQEDRIKSLELSVAETMNRLNKALDRIELLEQNVSYIERDVDRGHTLEA